MGSDFVIGVAGQAVYTILLASSPLLLLALGVGLVVSILQATTQIQEPTLAFIPKILAVLIGLLLFGSWILSTLTDYTFNILNNLHQFIG